MEKGWFKIHRRFFNSTIWNEERMYSRAEAFMDLIYMARFEAKREIIQNRVIELQPGQIPAARRLLMKRWNWGSSKVNNFLKLLELEGTINRTMNQGQTVITLCNYCEYQDIQTKNEPQIEPSTNHRRTIDEPSIKNIRIKELKNSTNVERKRTAFRPPTILEIQEYFLEKTGKQEFSKVQAQRFFDYYESNGWIVGKTKMKKWKNAVSGWINRQPGFEKEKSFAKKEKRSASSAWNDQLNKTA